MMKHLSCIAIVWCSIAIAGHAQPDFIKFPNDSLAQGFIRFYIDRNTGEQLIEFWRSKNQDQGIRYHKSQLEEYGLGKDRFVILKNFQPIETEDFIYDVIDAKVLESGTLELMRVPDPTAKGIITANPAGGGEVMMPAGKNSIDVLRFVRKKEIHAVPAERENFQTFIKDNFSEKAVNAFEKEEGKLTPGKLRKFVKFYNQKTASAAERN